MYEFVKNIRPMFSCLSSIPMISSMYAGANVTSVPSCAPIILCASSCISMNGSISSAVFVCSFSPFIKKFSIRLRENMKLVSSVIMSMFIISVVVSIIVYGLIVN